MSKFRVALLQMAGDGEDQRRNLEKGLDYCQQARSLGADLALFPKMWNTGYSKANLDTETGRRAFQQRALAPNDPFIQQHQTLARELEMGIGLTYLEATPKGPRNSLSIIDKQGHMVLTYAKVHTCDFGILESLCQPGDDFYVAPFRLDAEREVMLGAMICYDREAPESARILMLKGAEVVLTPNACTLESLRLDQFKTRAFENATGMAMTNYAAPSQNGHSVAFDGRGQLLVQAGEAEGIYLAEFDLDALREHRQRTIWGNAYRRPHRYRQLLSPDIDPVFERQNGLGQPFERESR